MAVRFDLHGGYYSELKHQAPRIQPASRLSAFLCEIMRGDVNAVQNGKGQHCAFPYRTTVPSTASEYAGMCAKLKASKVKTRQEQGKQMRKNLNYDDIR